MVEFKCCKCSEGMESPQSLDRSIREMPEVRMAGTVCRALTRRENQSELLIQPHLVARRCAPPRFVPDAPEAKTGLLYLPRTQGSVG